MQVRQQLWFAGAVALVFGAVGGCSTAAPEMGDAVRRNMALQVINPDPQYPAEAGDTHSGARAALSQRRYRTGNVTQPQVMSTTSNVEAGSSGSGNSGSGTSAGGSPR